EGQDVQRRFHRGKGVKQVRDKSRLSSALFAIAVVIYVGNVLGILLTVVLDSVSKGWYSGLLPSFLTGEWYKYVAGDHDIPNLLTVTFPSPHRTSSSPSWSPFPP